MIYRDQEGKLLRDQGTKVIECPECPPCGVPPTIECLANPDALLPETLTIAPDFCGNLSSQGSIYSSFIGDWIFTEVAEDDFVIAETADYRLTCTSFRVRCCSLEGVFWVYGVFAFYNWTGSNWNLLTTVSTAVNYKGATPCDDGTPVYDPNASLTINDTDPFNATFTFYPHYDIQLAGYGTEWATFTNDIGCADDEQPMNVEIS